MIRCGERERLKETTIRDYCTFLQASAPTVMAFTYTLCLPPIYNLLSVTWDQVQCVFMCLCVLMTLLAQVNAPIPW